MTATQPVQHVVRPTVPWRDDATLTECGRPVNDVAGAMTRDVFVARVAKLGKTRAAMDTCMTCWHTAIRHPTWEQDPAGAMRRLPGHLWDDTDPLYPGCEGRCPGCIRRDINDDMRAVRREDR